MARSLTLAAAALLVAYAHREHNQARARQSSATTQLMEAIEMYGASDDLLQDARALVGEWQAAEFAAVNPDSGDGA